MGHPERTRGAAGRSPLAGPARRGPGPRHRPRPARRSALRQFRPPADRSRGLGAPVLDGARGAPAAGLPCDGGRRHHQCLRAAARTAHCIAQRARTGPGVRGRARRGRRRARANAGLGRAPAQLQRDRRGQCRHRRFRPRAAPGGGGPARFQRRPLPRAFPQQRRCRRHGGADVPARSRTHGGRARVQEFRHPGDLAQRRAAAALARRRFAPVRGQRQRGQGGRAGHSRRAHPADVGLGRRALFPVVRGGLRRGAGPGHGALPRVARRRGRHGCARAGGAAGAQPRHLARACRGVESQRPWPGHARGAALRRPAGAAARLPAAAGHGKPGQVGAQRRHAGGRGDGAGAVGRAGHQQPAQFLPGPAPGHRHGAERFHRRRAACAPAPWQPRCTALAPACAGRGAGQRSRQRRSAEGLSRQPSVHLLPARRTHAGEPRRLAGPVRAQRVRAVAAVGHQCLRPVGRGTGQADRRWAVAGGRGRGGCGSAGRSRHAGPAGRTAPPALRVASCWRASAQATCSRTTGDGWSARVCSDAATAADGAALPSATAMFRSQFS